MKSKWYQTSKRSSQSSDSILIFLSPVDLEETGNRFHFRAHVTARTPKYRRAYSGNPTAIQRQPVCHCSPHCYPATLPGSLIAVGLNFFCRFVGCELDDPLCGGQNNAYGTLCAQSVYNVRAAHFGLRCAHCGQQKAPKAFAYTRRIRLSLCICP